MITFVRLTASLYTSVMIKNAAALLALSGLVASEWTSKTGSCNTGTISCCNTSKDSQKSTGEQDSLLALGNILDQVSLQCLQIPILAIAIEDECKNTPVCCDGVENDGLIGLSCSPLALI
ncbi:hypothetical protein E3P99_02507 [Wallemia hederae]|uniref:Hydrophobin n=1 Tax=Wallemia hederae TaxID=1540922 RepID=A0A4T0FK17_9BASI|nr:hypothetical protein E3P99_02507 [Wallemia hederae]